MLYALTLHKTPHSCTRQWPSRIIPPLSFQVLLSIFVLSPFPAQLLPLVYFVNSSLSLRRPFRSNLYAIEGEIVAIFSFFKSIRSVRQYHVVISGLMLSEYLLFPVDTHLISDFLFSFDIKCSQIFGTLPSVSLLFSRAEVNISLLMFP